MLLEHATITWLELLQSIKSGRMHVTLQKQRGLTKFFLFFFFPHMRWSSYRTSLELHIVYHTAIAYLFCYRMSSCFVIQLESLTVCREVSYYVCPTYAPSYYFLVLQVLTGLEAATNCVDDMDEWLGIFNVKLRHMREDIESVGISIDVFVNIVFLW